MVHAFKDVELDWDEAMHAGHRKAQKALTEAQYTAQLAAQRACECSNSVRHLRRRRSGR